MTSDDSEAWGKDSSKPKSSDHKTHLLTVSDCSQRAGQGHSISARPPGQVPGTALHSVLLSLPSHPRENRMGLCPWAGRHLSQCQLNNHHLCVGPGGGAVGRALVIYDTWAPSPSGWCQVESSASQGKVSPFL